VAFEEDKKGRFIYDFKAPKKVEKAEKKKPKKKSKKKNKKKTELDRILDDDQAPS